MPNAGVFGGVLDQFAVAVHHAIDGAADLVGDAQGLVDRFSGRRFVEHGEGAFRWHPGFHGWHRRLLGMAGNAPLVPVDQRQRPWVAHGGRRGLSYARLAVRTNADQPQLGHRFRDGSARPVLIWAVAACAFIGRAVCWATEARLLRLLGSISGSIAIYAKLASA